MRLLTSEIAGSLTLALHTAHSTRNWVSPRAPSSGRAWLCPSRSWIALGGPESDQKGGVSVGQSQPRGEIRDVDRGVNKPLEQQIPPHRAASRRCEGTVLRIRRTAKRRGSGREMGSHIGAPMSIVPRKRLAFPIQSPHAGRVARARTSTCSAIGVSAPLHCFLGIRSPSHGWRGARPSGQLEHRAQHEPNLLQALSCLASSLLFSQEPPDVDRLDGSDWSFAEDPQEMSLEHPLAVAAGDATEMDDHGQVIGGPFLAGLRAAVGGLPRCGPQERP
jgi:hypothetical protein